MLRMTGALLAFFLLSPAHAAEGADNCTGTIVSLPATISTPGIWCLKRHVYTAITSGAAITIDSDDVTLDCNDFKIGGLPGNVNTDTVGISATHALNVTIRHCVIRGFLEGIRLDGNASGGSIEDNRLDQNTVAGIHLAGSGHVVRGNRINSTGRRPASTRSDGIVSTADDCRILENVVMGVAVAGSGGDVTGIRSEGNACEVAWNRIAGLVPDTNGDAIAIDLGASAGGSIHRNQLLSHPSTPATAILSGPGNQCGNNSSSGWAGGIVGCTDAGSNFSQ
jgi:parallel beta-helix repeat protein